MGDGTRDPRQGLLGSDCKKGPFVERGGGGGLQDEECPREVGTGTRTKGRTERDPMQDGETDLSEKVGLYNGETEKRDPNVGPKGGRFVGRVEEGRSGKGKFVEWTSGGRVTFSVMEAKGPKSSSSLFPRS